MRLILVFTLILRALYDVLKYLYTVCVNLVQELIRKVKEHLWIESKNHNEVGSQNHDGRESHDTTEYALEEVLESDGSKKRGS